MQRFPSSRLELYQAKLSSKKSWGKNAEALQQAAILLEPEVIQACKEWRKILEGQQSVTFSDGLMRVYLLLQAYALENLLKGELVKKMARRQKDNRLKKIPKDLCTHDLVQISKNIGLRLSTAETNLLKRLSRFAIWAARYPVPLDVRHFDPTFLNSSDIEKVQDLINCVKNRFWKKN